MYLLPMQGVMYIRRGELRKMKGNVNTYSGMAVPAPAGEGFRFMPFWGIDLLKENLSNNLHFSKLFIFSLSYLEADAYAR